MVVLKQLGAGPELVHCHATLTLEAFMTSAVTPMGVGGAGVVYCSKTVSEGNWLHHKYIPLAGRETVLEGDLLLPILPRLA